MTVKESVNVSLFHSNRWYFGLILPTVNKELRIKHQVMAGKDNQYPNGLI